MLYFNHWAYCSYFTSFQGAADSKQRLIRRSSLPFCDEIVKETEKGWSFAFSMFRWPFFRFSTLIVTFQGFDGVFWLFAVNLAFSLYSQTPFSYENGISIHSQKSHKIPHEYFNQNLDSGKWMKRVKLRKVNLSYAKVSKKFFDRLSLFQQLYISYFKFCLLLYTGSTNYNQVWLIHILGYFP